jgi:carbonic anhydrase
LEDRTVSALEALARLREGNRRFVAASVRRDGHVSPERRRALLGGQAPFAVILGCSDSRVPAELVFDKGLGDLFVVRVAGNIAAPSQVASVALAAERIGTRLVVVLGHTGCGAVTAAVQDLRQPAGPGSLELRAILDHIQPAVAPLVASAAPEALAGFAVPGPSGLSEPTPGPAEDLVDRAVRANVRAVAARLREESPILRRLIREDGLLVVGALYYLGTGVVEFFDGLPEAL